jgi:apolipoprotein N-acyltransferase
MFVRSSGTPLLFGSPTYEKKERHQLLWNSAFLLGRDGLTKAVYHKSHLVPFGEYVPLKGSLFFFMDKLVQGTDDFQTGRTYTVMSIHSAMKREEITISTVICFEIIFPDLVRRFVDQGATVMTTITNDAWFGRTSAPFQHFSMAVFRSVENRVPVARAANTGVSGFIDAKGRILETSNIFTEAALTRTLVPGSTKTFYTRHGDVFAWLCILEAVAAIIPWPRRHRVY